MKHKNLIVVVPLFIFSLVASACQGVIPMVEVTEPQASTSTVSQLIITATNKGFDAPSTTSSSWTNISLMNQSEGMHQAGLYRLPEGKVAEDVLTALASAEVLYPEWLTPVGGPVVVPPGISQTVAINLNPGDYVVMNVVPGPDGVNPVTKGYFIPLSVEDAETASLVPVADMTLTLVDYTFVFDYEAVTAGKHIIEVSNQGPQEDHEVVFIRLDEGIGIQDFLASFAPDAEPGLPTRIARGWISTL